MTQSSQADAKRARGALRYLAASALLLLFWALGSAALGEMLLPDPWATIRAFAESLSDPAFLGHCAASGLRLIGGLALALAVGFPFGLWFGHSDRADWLGAPLAFITYPLPKIVLLPVFFTIVGIGDASRVLLIALTTGYQILVIVRAEARALSDASERALRSMGASTFEILRHVWLPAALPSLFTGLKVASGTAVAVLFLAESFATDSGLGWLIMDAWGMGDILRMFVGILGMSLMGVLLYAAVSAAEALCCRWLRAGR